MPIVRPVSSKIPTIVPSIPSGIIGISNSKVENSRKELLNSSLQNQIIQNESQNFQN